MTLRCARSVFTAEKITDHKTVLVDNGSTTDSYNAVAAEIASRGEFVRLAPNQGFARGMNAGLKAAFEDPTTVLALSLSNDIEIDECFYRIAGELAQSDDAKRAVIWCPSVFYLMERTKPAYTHGRFDSVTQELSHFYEPGRDPIRFPEYYPGAAMVWTRAAFEKTGGFNEAYYCYWEDVELSYRCTQLGIELRPCSELKTYHLGRGTTGGKRAYSEHFEQGRRLTLEIIAKKS